MKVTALLVSLQVASVVAIFGFGNDKDKDATTISSTYHDGLDDSELDIFSTADSTVLVKAINWILQQRKSEIWNKEISRIAILSSLIDTSVIDEKYKQLISKELTSTIMMDLIHDTSGSFPSENKLSQQIKALKATCQDPKNFYGQNLVQKLRALMALRNPKEPHSPGLYLSLCLADSAKHEDYNGLHLSMNSYYNLNRQFPMYDLEAYIHLATAVCSNVLSSHAKDNPYFTAFNHSLHYFLKTVKEPDVYTEALMLQALNAWSSHPQAHYLERERNLLNTSLVKKQREDGSFGDFLATYYALPAIAGKSFINMRNVTCNEKLARLKVQPTIGDKTIETEISLFITRNGITERNTLKFLAPEGSSVLDAMYIAAEKNPLYKFKVEESDLGKFIYSIAGIPNDSEKQQYWNLYIIPNSNNLNEIKAIHRPHAYGLQEQIRMNYNLLFWYKTV